MSEEYKKHPEGKNYPECNKHTEYNDHPEYQPSSTYHSLQNELVEMRRQLHRIPELGLKLPKTAAYVTQKLAEYGVPYTLCEKDSGVIAVIEGTALPAGAECRTLAFRADMDALPIREMTGVSYASEHDGCMHACGHDAHTAMLLGTAKLLMSRRSELKGRVKLLFQTAEEVSGGAAVMIDRGALDHTDAIFGIHIGSIIDSSIPSGTVIASPGVCMAANDRFIITVEGKGCHGSTPEKGIDPINIAAHIVLALQSISTRELNAADALTLSIGSIHGGMQYNVIPDNVVLEGTIRTFDPDVRSFVQKRIVEIAESTALVFGGSAKALIDPGTPPLINSPQMAELAAKAAACVVGRDHVITAMKKPNMGGEDFACYLQQVPGAFLFLSSSDKAKRTDIPHHNPRFNIDEEVLWEGPALFAEIAKEFFG